MRPIVRLTACALLIAASQSFAQAPGAAAAPAPGQGASKPAKAGAAVPAAVPGQPLPKPKPTRNASFYTAEVTFNSQAEQRGAKIRALGQVVVRLTGNPAAASNNLIRRSGANIEALITSSSTRQDSEIVNGLPVYRSILTVSFDPDNVDALIGAAGLKFWTAERPKPILWLAIDDGRGPRLVTGQQTNVVKPLATRGLERGMRFLLPAGSSIEQAAIRSIWTLNAPAMQVLTERYRSDAQLIGKVYRQPPGWAADWLLTQGGVELARWSYSDSDPRRVIASGVDEGANAIANRDAVFLETGVAGVFTIDVIGVDTQADFIRLMSYLETMAIVKRVTITEATPEQLRLQLDLSLGMKGFRTMIGTGGVLRAAAEPEDGTMPVASGAVPRFTLQ
jgi:hypothetical protein